MIFHDFAGYSQDPLAVPPIASLQSSARLRSKTTPVAPVWRDLQHLDDSDGSCEVEDDFDKDEVMGALA